jgi:putative tryptophan/tyrosine transport system substrate-binding protein
VLVAWLRCLAAQQTQRVFRIGVLSPGTTPPGPLHVLRQGLRDLGYEDGRNISIEWRFSGATDDRLRELAEELVRLKVDVIVAINTPASLAAKRATATTPIVIARVSDPNRIQAILTQSGLVEDDIQPQGRVPNPVNFTT